MLFILDREVGLTLDTDTLSNSVYKYGLIYGLRKLYRAGHPEIRAKMKLNPTLGAHPMTSTDGTTAIQVSPIPTETEMNGFRSMLDRALNAIVQASELAKVVDNLKVEVAQFSQDIESQRRRNQELDEMLSHVRAQRDKAEAELSHAQSENIKLSSDLSFSYSEKDRLISDMINIKAELEATKNTLAGEQDARTEAELSLEEAKAKLAEIENKMKAVFGFVKPEPVPTPEPSGHPLTVTDIQEVKPEDAHAEQAQAKRKVWEDEPGFDWSNPNITWDHARNARFYKV